MRTSPHFVENGTWSDDAATALALAASLLDCGGLNPQDLAEKLAAWQFQGRYAVDGFVFDIGVTTSDAIGRFLDGVPHTKPGRTTKWRTVTAA